MQPDQNLSWDDLPAVIKFPHEFASLVEKSESAVYRWHRLGIGPKVVSVATYRVVTRESALAWRKKFEQ